MSRTVSFAAFAAFSLVLMLAASRACQAQSNAPLTAPLSGGGGGAAAPLPTRPVVRQVSTPLPSAVAPAEPAPAAFGDVTRGLLAAQADGRRAGAALPVLGEVSSAAWNRYVDSFTRPIPEWFSKRVQTNNTN